MEEKQVTSMSTGIRYGALLGVATIAFMALSHFLGFSDMTNTDVSGSLMISIVQYLMVFGILYLGLKYYRDNNEGLMTFGEGLSTAMFIALISGIIYAVATYIYAANFIDPNDLMDAVAESTGEDMEDMDEEAAEMMSGMMNAFASPAFMSITAFIMRIFGGLIFGSIASMILKKGD